MSIDQDALKLVDFAARQVAYLEKGAEILRDKASSPREDADEEVRKHMLRIAEHIEKEAHHLKTLVPRILTEGGELATRAAQSKYVEQLEEIDGELAKRESRFRLILRRHRWHTRRLAREIKRRAQANDISFSIHFYEISQLFEFTHQLTGQRGFLTNDLVEPLYSSSASQMVARRQREANESLSRESVDLSWKLFLKYRIRYVVALMQRFASEAAVSLLIFVLLVEFLLHQFHVQFFIYGIVILTLAYVAEKVISAHLRKHRVQRHSRALFVGVSTLYSDYLVFLRARAIARIATHDRNNLPTESAIASNEG
jgi:hypothetical protein